MKIDMYGKELKGNFVIWKKKFVKDEIKGMCKSRVKCCNSQQIIIIIIHLEEKINMEGRKSQEKISEKPGMKQYKVMREKYQWLEIW